MTVPLATTKITVLRAAHAGDFYDERPNAVEVARDVAAHISSPGGNETFGTAGRGETVNQPFGCDVTDVTGEDEIVDQVTGARYQVVWVQRRAGLGLDHMVGELSQTTGVNS